MTLCQYLVHAKLAAGAFARRCGIPSSTMYRWREEELQFGRIRKITGTQLVRLIDCSGGLIKASAVLGLGREHAAA